MENKEEIIFLKRAIEKYGGYWKSEIILQYVIHRRTGEIKIWFYDHLRNKVFVEKYKPEVKDAKK